MCIRDRVKLDPSKKGDDSIVWRFHQKAALNENRRPDGGIFATLSLFEDSVYTTTHTGHLIVLNKDTGEMTYNDPEVGYHAWGSSVVSQGRLLVPTTSPGGFRIYDLTKNSAVPELLSSYVLRSRGAVESTPLVFGGRIVVGSRDGYI